MTMKIIKFHEYFTGIACLVLRDVKSSSRVVGQDGMYLSIFVNNFTGYRVALRRSTEECDKERENIMRRMNHLTFT